MQLKSNITLIWKRLPCLALFGLFTGCVGAAIPPTHGEIPSSAKTIAIVSLLPETLSESHVGLTVFNNKSAIFPAEFSVNDDARNVAAQVLSASYKVIPLKVDNAAFFAAVKNTPPNTWMGPVRGAIFTDPVVQAELRTQIKPGTVDMIIVFDGTYPTSPQGLGAFSRGFLQPSVFVLLSHFEVFDGVSFEEITSSNGEAADNIFSNLQWDGESYDSLSSQTKAAMAGWEHQAVYAYVKGVLQRANLAERQ